MFSDFACLPSGAPVRHLLKMQPLSTFYAYFLLLSNILLVLYPVVFSGKKKSKSCRRKTKKTPVMGFFFIYFSISALTLSAYTCKKEQRFQINYSHLNLGKASGLTEKELKAFKKAWIAKFAQMFAWRVKRHQFLDALKKEKDKTKKCEKSKNELALLCAKRNDLLRDNKIMQSEREKHAQEIAELRKSLESLEKKYKQEKLDREAAEHKILSLKENYVKHSIEVDFLKFEKDQFSKQMRELQDQNCRLSVQVLSNQSELDKSQENHARVNQELFKSNHRAKDLQELILRFFLQVGALQRQFIEYRLKLANAEKENLKKQSELTKANQALKLNQEKEMEERHAIGVRLYQMVFSSMKCSKRFACKITGMFLELKRPELLEILSDQGIFLSALDQAVFQLHEAGYICWKFRKAILCTEQSNLKKKKYVPKK
jgi:hypothetical protein